MLQEAEAAFEGNAMTMEMLERLQQLPWRRIDADFSATSMPFFAHNLIQVWSYSPSQRLCKFPVLVMLHPCREGDVFSQICGRVKDDPCVVDILEASVDMACALQVTRKWLNWEGAASVQHIAALIEEMEEDPRVQRALTANA